MSREYAPDKMNQDLMDDLRSLGWRVTSFINEGTTTYVFENAVQRYQYQNTKGEAGWFRVRPPMVKERLTPGDVYRGVVGTPTEKVSIKPKIPINEPKRAHGPTPEEKALREMQETPNPRVYPAPPILPEGLSFSQVLWRLWAVTEALAHPEGLGAADKYARKKLIELCEDIVAKYSDHP